VQGVQGILDAYEKALLNVGLSGPTNFSPVISAVTQEVQTFHQVIEAYNHFLWHFCTTSPTLQVCDVAVIMSFPGPHFEIFFGAAALRCASDSHRWPNNRHERNNECYRTRRAAAAKVIGSSCVRYSSTSDSFSICSIIIVGVGSDNFENMNILDGDERPYSARDIVQVRVLCSFFAASPSAYTASVCTISTISGQSRPADC
jgi:hypothetical protein